MGDVTESLLEALRRRGTLAREVSFKCDFFGLPEPAQAALYGLAALVEQAADSLEYEQSRVSQAYGAPWPEHQRTIDAARGVCPEAVALLESRIAYLSERFDGHQRVIGDQQRAAFGDLGRIRKNVARAWRYRGAAT